jgi:dolichyl-phosphate-mannose-protein mannosyltransferase
VVGAAIRIEQFGWRRSLWLDEALITANIVHRSFAGLLHPLSGQQGAPIGWLWGERLAVVLLGNNEYALRVIPLLAGLVALALIYRVVKPVAGPWAAALATTLLALSPGAVRYSVEVKQYSTDLAIALGLAVVARWALRGTRRSIALWGIGGALAVWCSHPAVFVMSGTAVVLLVTHRANRSRLIGVLAASAVWAVSLGVDWLVSLRTLGNNSYLHGYWAAGFAPTPLRLGADLTWLWRAPVRVVHDPMGMPAAGLASLVILVGFAWALRARPAQSAILVVPIVLGVVGGAVGAYPLEGRMALWVVGFAFAGLAAAAAGAAELLQAGHDAVFRLDQAAHLAPRQSGRWGAGLVAALCVAFLVQGPIRQVGTVAHDPTTWIDLRPLLQAVRPMMRPGDVVWVHSGDAPSAAYYAISTGVAPDGVIYDGPAKGLCPGDAVAVAARGRRVWFVFGYQSSTSDPYEQGDVEEWLGASAHLEATVRRPQATATLWDFSARPDNARPTGPFCVGVDPSAPPVPTGLSSGPLGSGTAT